jgi:hypothetical protein
MQLQYKQTWTPKNNHEGSKLHSLDRERASGKIERRDDEMIFFTVSEVLEARPAGQTGF